METEKLVSVSISIPRNYRDQLRKMAAEASLKNPEEFTSISELGRAILCEHLKKLVTEAKEEKGYENSDR